MHDKATLLKEMGDALTTANRCSEALEKLLTEAREAGGATPELRDRIGAVNQECNDLMHLYLEAYCAHYEQSRDDKRMLPIKL